MKKLFLLMFLVSAVGFSQEIVKQINYDSISKINPKDYYIIKDDFSGLLTIKPKTSFGARSKINIFIEKSGRTTMSFITSYSGRSWIFFNKFTFLIKGEYYTFNTGDTRRNVKSTANIEEVATVPVDDGLLKALVEVASQADDVKVRLEGDKVYSDILIKKKERQYLQEMLDVFNRL